MSTEACNCGCGLIVYRWSNVLHPVPLPRDAET